MDDSGAVVGYNEFDPYGNPVNNTSGGEPYGYTGEWYEGYTELLHLRARWYSPETGTFLSRDAILGEPPYQYARGNPINLTDAAGNSPPCDGGCDELAAVHMPIDMSSVTHTQGFGPTDFALHNRDGYAYAGGMHSGIDFIAPSSPLYAVGDNGVVINNSSNKYVNPSIVVRYKHHLVIYGHRSEQSKQDGETVNNGDVIGKSGVGWGSSHLHYEVRELTKEQADKPCNTSVEELKLTENILNPLAYPKLLPNGSLESIASLAAQSDYYRSFGWAIAPPLDLREAYSTLVDTDNNGYPDQFDVTGDGVPDALHFTTKTDIAGNSEPMYWQQDQVRLIIKKGGAHNGLSKSVEAYMDCEASPTEKDTLACRIK